MANRQFSRTSQQAGGEAIWKTDFVEQLLGACFEFHLAIFHGDGILHLLCSGLLS
jgi:hypothetical protein